MSETSVSNVRHLSVWRRSFGRRPTAGSLLWLSISARSINSFHIFQQLNGSDCCGFLALCNSIFLSPSIPQRNGPTHSILTIFYFFFSGLLTTPTTYTHTHMNAYLSGFPLIWAGGQSVCVAFSSPFILLFQFLFPSSLSLSLSSIHPKKEREQIGR